MHRLRVLVTILALALVASACGTDQGTERRLLRYGYAPGDTIAYDTTGSVAGTLAFTGPIEPGVTEGSVTIDVDFGARVTYAVSEGDDPTLSVITITQEITALDGSIDAMGETQTLSLADLDGMPPITVMATVDELGNVVELSVGGEDIPLDAGLGELGDLGALGGLGGLGDLGGLGGQLLDPEHLGPTLPDEPVGVGDVWTSSSEEGPVGLPVDQSVRNEITAEETLGERTVLRIDTTVTTAATSLGLSELLAALLAGAEGFDAEPNGGDDLGIDPETMGGFLEAMGVVVDVSIDETVGTATTWFDAADGIVVRHEATTPLTLSVSLQGIPEMGDVSMDLDATATSSLQLVE